jgi:hypothetical protein
VARQRNRPSFDEFHRLGETVSRQLEGHCSFREIGEAIGVTKQRAWHIGMVALGKVAWQLREQYRER